MKRVTIFLLCSSLLCSCRNNVQTDNSKLNASVKSTAEESLPDYSWVKDSVSYIKANDLAYLECKNADDRVYSEWLKEKDIAYLECKKANDLAFSECLKNGGGGSAELIKQNKYSKALNEKNIKYQKALNKKMAGHKNNWRKKQAKYELILKAYNTSKSVAKKQ